MIQQRTSGFYKNSKRKAIERVFGKARKMFAKERAGRERLSRNPGWCGIGKECDW